MAQEIFREADQNPFDAPIPGQSLTNEPGNSAWEHPAQFADVDSAMEFVMKKLTNENMNQQILLMLKNKIPVEAITRLIVFGGFVEGKWTVDVATLITPLVMQLIGAMGMRAKVKEMTITMTDRSNGQFMKNMANLEVLQEKASEDIKEELEQMPPQEGMMARPQPQGGM